MATLDFKVLFLGNNRDYIQVKLVDSLVINKCYSVEFYTNLVNFVPWAINNVGAYISNNAIHCTPPNPYNLTPQILLPGNPVISDTVNWVKVYGIYSATGGEDYITIGNFAYDSNTVFLPMISSGGHQSYYYVDDVSLYEIKSAKALYSGNDTTICNSGFIQLGTTNYEGVTYRWSPAAGLSDSTSGTPTASPTHTTTYYLTQTTPCATTTDSVKVTVYCEPPFIPLSIPTLISSEAPFYIKGLPTSSQLKLYNQLGQIIFQTDNYDNLLAAANFASGMYYYTLRTLSGDEYRGKICIISPK